MPSQQTSTPIPCPVDRDCIFKQSTRESISSVWIFFFFTENTLRKKKCYGSNSDTMFRDDWKLSTLANFTSSYLSDNISEILRSGCTFPLKNWYIWKLPRIKMEWGQTTKQFKKLMLCCCYDNSRTTMFMYWHKKLTLHVHAKTGMKLIKGGQNIWTFLAKEQRVFKCTDI